MCSHVAPSIAHPRIPLASRLGAAILEPSQQQTSRARPSIVGAVALCLALALPATARAEDTWGWAPGIKLGWTFGHGLTYGIEVSFIRLPDITFDKRVERPGHRRCSMLEAEGAGVHDPLRVQVALQRADHPVAHLADLRREP